MHTIKIEDDLMEIVRSFPKTSYRRDNSVYPADLIGRNDDVLWLAGKDIEKHNIVHFSGIKKLIFTRVKQDIFDYALELYKDTIEQVFLWKAPSLSDLSYLEHLPHLEYVVGFWNNKATALWNMSNNSKLYGVSLGYFSKITTLSDLKYSTLKEFNFEGNFFTSSKAELSDIEGLLDVPQLESLTLSTIKLPTNAIEVLSKLTNIKEIGFSSNQFTFEEFAFLKASLKNISNQSLGPYWDVDDEEVMIIGKKKPRLNKVKQAYKIEKYVVEYNDLVEKYKMNCNK